MAGGSLVITLTVPLIFKFSNFQIFKVWIITQEYNKLKYVQSLFTPYLPNQIIINSHQYITKHISMTQNFYYMPVNANAINWTVS